MNESLGRSHESVQCSQSPVVFRLHKKNEMKEFKFIAVLSGWKHLMVEQRHNPFNSISISCCLWLLPGVKEILTFFSSISGFFYILKIDISKLGMPRPQIGQSISQQGFFSSRDSLPVQCVSHPLHSYSAATSDMDLSRKNESKSSSKLKPGEQPLLGSWNPSTAPRPSIVAHPHPTATSASTNHLTSNNGNGVNSNNNADRWVNCFFSSKTDEFCFFILLTNSKINERLDLLCLLNSTTAGSTNES